MLSTGNGEGRIKIRCQAFRGERLRLKNDSWRINQLARWRCSRTIPNQTLEIQKWWLILQGSFLPRATTLDFGAAPWDISTKYPFASTPTIANNFLTTVLTIKDILQRESKMKQFLLCWVSHSPSPSKHCSCWGIKMDVANFPGTQSKPFWWNCNGRRLLVSIFLFVFQNFAGLPEEIIPRTRRAISDKETMITLFFAIELLTVRAVLPQDSNLTQLYFIDDTCPNLEK